MNDAVARDVELGSDYFAKCAVRDIAAGYSVVEAAEPGIWKWQFQIGDQIKTGVTATKLFPLASRRVQLKINRAISAQSVHFLGGS